MKAYVSNDWKLLRLPEPFGSGSWELYNLGTDPGEMHDVSRQNPEITASLLESWEKYTEQNSVFDHKGYFDAIYRKAYGVKE